MREYFALLLVFAFAFGCTANARYQKQVRVACPNCSHDYASLIDICVQECRTI